jgi:hypothetical protein
VVGAGAAPNSGVYQSHLDRHGLSPWLPDDIDEAVEVRIQRQRVLVEGEHTFAILVEAAVLYNGIGGHRTMAEQLRHLLTVSKLPSVSLGVVPFQPDRVLRPVEGFWIFDDERVTVELVSGWLTLTHPKQIALYVQAFESLAAQAVYGQEAQTAITAATDPIRELGSYDEAMACRLHDIIERAAIQREAECSDGGLPRS